MIARLLLLLSLIIVAPISRAGFDPVMEDIDIFMTNPSIASERPNVLIILDTSANWGSYFATEKSALISVVNGLTDQYNVGLAHNAGGNIEGSYVRYAVRQMGSTNKTALSSMVNALSGAPSTSGGDKTNNSVAGLSLAEAYRYFKGLTSYSATTSNTGHAEKTDYSGNTTNSYITSLAGNAFASTPTTTSTYASPVTDGCQRNFIIYISNGKGSNQVGEKTTAMNLLATAKNEDVTATGDANTLKISPLSPSGNETDSWFDEWAKFLAQTGFSMTVGSSVRTITAQTYVVEVNPGAQSADLQWTATLKSGASKGKGKYFAATGDDPGASLLEALNAIFNEIQAVNSVFASTTLPVSVNVRGTNLNQVYIGMFRPDANKAPRWFGNLKLYKLALAADNKTLQMVDAAGSSAESNTTGFIVDTARSFWTIGSDFWSFRTEEENGQGGQSDSPDGDLVEKGAVAQQLRLAYASSQAARKLYTCTTGTYAGQCAPCTIAGAGTAKTCSSGTALSTTPFSTVNTDITTINLGLGTKDIASLSAKVTKSVTGIADRRNVAISNSLAGSKAITAIANGATSKTLSSLTPFDISKSMSISSLTAFGSATGTINVSAKSSSGSSVTLTFGQSGNPCSGKDTVVVAGNHASVNGTWSITSSAHVSNSPARSSVTFTVTGTPDPNNQGTINCMSKTTTATATVSSLPAGLTTSSRIQISGASPAAFNGNFQVNGVSGNTFTYTIGSSQGVATTAGTLDVYNTVSGGSYSATANTVRITGTTTANHGYAASNSVTLSGVTPSTSNGLAVYNSPVTLATASGATFTYDMSFAGSSNGYPPAAATAFGSVYAGATTTVTVTSATHGFPNLSTIDITGINSCYNVTGASLNYIGVDQFSYTTASACPPLSSIPVGAAVSGSSYSNTITATLASHGYAAGDQIVIANGTNTAHHGTFTVVTPAAVDPASSTFTYDNAFGNNPPSGPSGQYTVRLATNPLVYVTAPGHGFTTNDSITIAGAVPAGYNGTRSITRIDDDSFTFANTSGTEIGAYVSGTVTASENTTTARATSVNHGFANNASVVISGAAPNDFNGTFNIAYVDANTFTYPILTAQGDASGTIVAAAGTGSSSERDQIINWVRGQDNQENENSNGVTTDCRASVHGDVLHSRPAVINYNRYGGDNDVYIFYGANDGVFHAIKGGYGTDSDDNNGLSPGQEAWGFVPTEGFSNLKRLRNNSPVIGSSFKRPYFLDGPIGIYSVDGNADGKILAASATDHVYLYVGARRGGRYMYSLDVTNPTAPSFRWKIDNSISGFEELGYTWSLPQPVSNINARTNPVLIFGGGYDPQVEDIENCTITATSAASYNAGTGVYTPGTVTHSAGTITYASSGTGCTVANPVATTKTRGMGRALYVVDAVTGEKIWSASYRGSGADLEVAGMDFAIPSDITVIKNTTGGKTNRAYFGDTGGNMWRFDFNDINPKNWTITKIASISTLSSAANRRKFLYPPDVVSQVGYDAIMVGAGDREHPFDNTVTNRFYLFKDRGSDLGPGTGDTHYLADSNSDSVGETLTVNSRTGVAAGSGNPVISHSPAVATDGELYDATNNCVQEACSGSTAAEKAAAKTAQANLISAADGWFITLGVGEKVIGNAVALNGIVFFNTNQPSQEADASCVGNLGIARQYQVQMADAGAWDPENTGTKTKSDRSSVHAGGGYLPSPVHVVVQVEDSEGNMVTKEGVISGTEVQTPTTGAIGSRTRRYWYKEID